MALIDLDNFKDINDQYGHPIGDKVLKRFAQKCIQYFPPPALCGRMGGEEFAILLLNAPEAQTYKMMNSFRLEISEYVFAFDDIEIEIKLTISIGLSELKRTNSTVNLLYSASDKALYKAKRNGRNKVEIATS
jgi:diguanylate cyclase (GGDEF)-like protein